MVNYFQQITPLNIPGALQTGFAARGQQLQNEALVNKMKAAQNLSALEKQMLQDPTPAVTQRYIGAAGPDRANKFLDLQEEQQQRGYEALARPALAIRSAPPERKEVVYQQQMQELKANGMDVSQFPSSYEGNEASIDQTVNEIINKARKFEDIAKPDTPPASGVQEYMDPATGQTRQFDLTNPSDRAELVAPGAPWVRAPRREEVGGPGDFSGTKKQAEDLSERLILTKQATATANSIIDTLDSTPGVMSDITTFILKPLKRLSVDAKDAARVFGVNVRASSDPDKYKDVLSTMDIRSRDRAGIESAIVNLAFTAALASGQSGKSVSDKDVKRFLQEIGAGQIDDDNFKFVLREFTGRLQRNFGIRYETFHGNPYEGGFGVSARKPAAPQYREGQTATHPTTGAKMIFKGGQWQTL